MKVTDHIEQLLRQGRKRKELVELGFPKSVVTRVYRCLHGERRRLQPKPLKGVGGTERHSQPVATSQGEVESIQQKLNLLEAEFERQEEWLVAVTSDLEDMEGRLNGTPALGLRHRFSCDCGAPGFVAVRIRCTKCV